MENQEAENNNTSESGQPGGKKDGMKYLQLSTTAFMFAIGLFLNLMVDPQFIKDYQDQVNVITEVLTWLLLVISIGIGLLSLLYKYIIYDPGHEKLEWFEKWVEDVSNIISKIGVLPLVVGAIVGTLVVYKYQTINIIQKECCVTPTATYTPPPAQTATSTSTPTPTATHTPPPTFTDTPSPTPTPTPEITGCVIIYALNVRSSPGVQETPSNVETWLRSGDCVTILSTREMNSQAWANIIIKGWVALNARGTQYVITLTPTASQNTNVTQP